MDARDQHYRVPFTIFVIVCYTFAKLVEEFHLRGWQQLTILIATGLVLDFAERRVLPSLRRRRTQ